MTLVLALLALSANSPPAAMAPQLAKNPLDVAVTTLGNYASVAAVCGTLCFPWNLVRRQPAAWASAWATGSRWGKISAGFSGGRAAGQVIRRADDSFCAILGAVAGGIAAAPTLAEAPSNVATFVAFTYVLEVMAPSKTTDTKRPSKPKPGQRPRFGAPLTAEEKRLQARRNRDVKRNVFGEPVGAGLRKGGRLDRAVQQLHS